jgi:hypothetical protein
MPNLDAPNGFVPVRHLNGGTVRYTGGYSIDSGEASDLFLGDVVILDTATGDGNNIVPYAAAGGDIVGIFAGCQYTAANGDVVWAKQWVSGTATLGGVNAEAFVYVDPNIVFSVQFQGTLVAADVNSFADAAVAAGNAANGISAFELDSTVGATGQFQIIGLADAPDGIFKADISAANPRVEVIAAEHIHQATNT